MRPHEASDRLLGRRIYAQLSGPLSSSQSRKSRNLTTKNADSYDYLCQQEQLPDREVMSLINPDEDGVATIAPVEPEGT